MIYWSDRNGECAPQNARFSFYPFLKGAPLAAQQRKTLSAPRSYKIVSSHYLPDKKGWIERVKKALQKKIAKVVLARCHVLELAEPPDPFAIAAALQKRREGAYLFCYAHEGGAFVGASPERLFAREERMLETEALAGTTTDLKAVKENREHLFVEQFLTNTLAPLSVTAPLFQEKKLHQTYNLQHLYSRARIELLPHVTDEMLLDALHPTPALCGTPTAEARDLIAELEPFDRGLYGGVVGWQAGDRSEWAVAIRSCTIKGRFAYLYTGAGIVEGSDPEKEWEELNQKEALFAGIFQ